ncbi:MAG TPA: T9SS type A sorting domain-containing protein [Bacteroidales bacterium]|nr:T9SS type A sorting domain-containing protein [Bacteroidales bacterium]HOR81044.1 T9SS type A sorting domain-containing protein [Bacteroidales bacterium]HPJ91099.1 T9SS type A sorting domain-containing protein [Bacteroidales bacterium]
MKTKNLFVILLLTISYIHVSQCNEIFIDTNMIWQNLETCGLSEKNFFIKLSSDTLIHTNTYKKVIYSEDTSFNRMEHIGYIREENNQLYYRDKTTQQEGLLYDFNLMVGDTIHVVNYFLNSTSFTLNLIRIDSILINGQQVRKFVFDNTSEYWIEGIGSSFGLLNVGYRDTTSCEYNLICCKKGEYVYLNPNYSDCDFETNSIKSIKINDVHYNIYPNPVNNYAILKISKCNISEFYFEIFNLLGIKVYQKYFYNDECKIDISSLNNGIYIYVITNNKIIIGKGKIVKQYNY